MVNNLGKKYVDRHLPAQSLKLSVFKNALCFLFIEAHVSLRCFYAFNSNFDVLTTTKWFFYTHVEILHCDRCCSMYIVGRRIVIIR